MPTKKEQQKKADAKRAGLRTRNYVTIVYPESAPQDWQERLSAMHVEAFVSPLHDQDCNPDGEPKKAHYHVMVKWSSVKTKEQALAAFEEIGGVGAEAVSSTRGMARYLCHLDNPEKAQYSVDDVIAFGGADYLADISLPTDKYSLLAEMMFFIEDNDINEFRVLQRLVFEINQSWWRCLIDNSSFLKNYISSKRHSTAEENAKLEELLAKYKK